MDPGGISVDPHRPAQGVDFANHVSFRQASNRRVARHLAYGIQVLTQEKGFGAQARCGQSRLNSRVAGTDHNDIVEFGEKKLFHVESDQTSARF